MPTPTIIKDPKLQAGEYGTDIIKKDTIVIHHTAGGHRPDWVIAGWNSDRAKDGKSRLRVATSYVIGGISTSDGDTSWDGKIINCFPDNMWAHHLGTTAVNNANLNQKSIAIEICNYGQLTLSSNGTYFNYVNKPVPAALAIKLSKAFRGFTYYHRYTKNQLKALKDLLLYLSDLYKIDLKKGLQEYINRESLKVPKGLTLKETQKWLNKNGYKGKDGLPLVEDGKTGENTDFAIANVGRPAFELNPEALAGYGGLWTHTNYRSDKTDCSPQPELIDLIISL
jgi:hypothetical protein